MFLRKMDKLKIALFLGLVVTLVAHKPVLCVLADTVTGATGVAGISSALNVFYSEQSVDEEKECILTARYEIPDNIAIASVNNQLNIRKGPSTSKERVGLLDDGDACVIESVEGEWAKVKSGEITGYVFLDYLLTGEDAIKYVEENYKPCVLVDKSVTNLHIRESASTTAEILSKVKGGTYLDIVNDCIINKEDENKVWVEVKFDKDKVGFVSAEYVTYTYEIPWAGKYTPYGEGVSDLRCNICDYAKQFIGTKYVWGGESLTKGCDCSGFVRQVYKHFGYSINRVSSDQAASLKSVSKDELKPGDLVFYGPKNGKVNHVAMYIGDGKIIHASTNNTKYYKGGDVEITSLYFYKGSDYGIKKYCRVLGKND